MAAERAPRLVVLGGGIIGVSTAFNVRRQHDMGKLDIVIVDRLGVAKAASGRAGGFLAKDWSGLGCSGVLARRSFLLYEELTNGTFDSTSIEYRKLDTLMVGDRKTKEGLPEWVDGVAATSCRSIGTTETTGQVHPRKVTEAMFEWLEEQSRLHPELGSFKLVGAVVEGLVFHPSSGNVTGVRLASGEIVEADNVALCLGPWMGSAAAWLEGASGWHERHISALKTVSGRRAHSLIYRLAPEIQARITPHALFGECDIYPRPNEVYACETAAEDEEPPANPEDIRVDDDRIRQLAKDCEDTSTLLAGEPAIVSCCYLPVSADGNPLVGLLNHNVFVAGGHSCWGILMAPITGVLMAALITGKQETLDPELAALIPQLSPLR